MRKLMIFVVLCLLTTMATAQNVTNVRFVQEGKMVKIYYDLSEEADISIYLSTDGGKTYEPSPLGHLSGHAGEEVTVGTNRCAVWDVLTDREKLQSSNVRFKVVAASRNGKQTFIVGGVRFTMVYVEGGTFTMGCTPEQGNVCSNCERPAHGVTLSDYWIGETEVTQALWMAVMGTTIKQQMAKNDLQLDRGEGNDYPMYGIDWDECQEFVRKLNQHTGRTFRLPTEAEWEYAARGGKKSRGYRYSGSNSPMEVAWCNTNSNLQTHPVKSKHPNELGLYDMSGNVWELCQDFWNCGYESISQINPMGPVMGHGRVMRGGDFLDGPGLSRVSNRRLQIPIYCGLRLVLSDDSPY